MKQLGKMKISNKKYKRIIKETERELKEINQDFMINFEENID